MGNKKRYSKEFITEVLAEVANIGLIKASQKYNIPDSTISNWINRHPEEYKEIEEKAKETFISKANKVIEKYLEHLLDENVIKVTSGKDSAIIIGTLRDKISLERGEPTERIEANEVAGILWRKVKQYKGD